MDNVLAPYLSAKDDGERQQYLDDLLTLRAAPLIRQVLRRRLGFYVSARGVNENNRDAEDLYQEAMTRVVQGLNRLPTAAAIENFEFYVSRVASNLCLDFLRAKSPARTRLKYRLRDLLKRRKDFLTWEHNGEVLCGFACWLNTRKRKFSDQAPQDIETELDAFKSLHFTDEEIHNAPLGKIIAEFFHWIGGPVQIDLLVRIVAYLLDVRDEQIESLDDPSRTGWDVHFVSNNQSGESHLEANELLWRLWKAVINLPREQRDSFVFSFEDQAGQDLFTVLLAAEIVNWDELAQGMGRSVAEVAMLRVRMPMDNATLAAALGASREHVYKWRFRAIQRLKVELKG
jgi:RNA polymerase sigma factor (sigma-70 family)